VFAIDDLLALEDLSPRERATKIFALLRTFLDIPVESRTAALTLLTESIQEHPYRDRIHSALNEFWSHHSYIRVISEAGMPDEAFLLRELLARALRHLLPVDEVGGDLYVLMDSLNLEEPDARWIGTLPDELVAEWADIFRPSRSSIVASCKLLALRATNIALSRDLIEFSDDEDITKSSFFDLPSVVERAARDPENLEAWDLQRAACEAQLQSVNRLLSEKGSSADIIFRVRLLRSLMGRIQQVITLDGPDSSARKLSIAIVHGFASQRRIGTVLAASTRRLARSVVEKTGRTGIHYIARDAAQWRRMGMGAILAGFITSFTALFKYSISAVIHAPLLIAFAHSMNYIVSFLLMQAGGFLLASKMPAATAAALVDAMEDPEKDHMASLRSISHTQFIVTIANLLGAVPVSILIDRIFRQITGHPFLTSAEADHGVHMLFPHTSGTIFFAIVTGVFLWLSSLATGWTANYIAVHKMSAAISNSIRIRKRLGHRLATRLAIWTRHHAAGSAGFIVLGILLGTMPILFELFGITLEVRHVTLAAAGLGYALDAQSVDGHLDSHEALLAFSGIAFIGVLNIATSFALSFILAVRARNIADAQFRRFLREIGRELLTDPLAFIFPRPKAKEVANTE
jgi:site-specific recombinase